MAVTQSFFKWFQLGVFCFGLGLLIISCSNKGKEEVVTIDNFLSTDALPDSLFLGDQECKKCHKTEFTEWKDSHHDKAMAVADSSTVLGDFNNSQITANGVTTKFYKKGKDYYIHTAGPQGVYSDYKVDFTFGVTPLQQYIVKFPNGAYQVLGIAWDTKKQKWFDLQPDFKIVHSEWLYWTNKGLNWNTMCAECHSTNLRKNYDYKTDSYNTQYSILNVSCEACHGPGKQHVTDVNALGDKYQPSYAMYMTSQTQPKELVDQCARCHMRAEHITRNFNFKGSLLDHYYPNLIEEPTYYADGQVRDEDYVYGSFLQSKMYKNNVSCKNCHNPHSLKLKYEGNRLCMQCHAP